LVDRSTDYLFYGRESWLILDSLSAYLKSLSADMMRQCSAKMMTFAHRSTDCLFYGRYSLWLIVFMTIYFMDVTLWLILDSLSAYLKSLSADMMRKCSAKNDDICTPFRWLFTLWA
jgi:hypothetical protein